jgi:hypothetical protein
VPTRLSKVTSKNTLNTLGFSSRAQIAAMALLQSTTTGLEIYVAAR